MPNALVVVLESSYANICNFLRTLSQHQKAASSSDSAQHDQQSSQIDREASQITNIRVMYYTDDIPARAFSNWTAHSISKHIPPDPDNLGATEKQVLRCLMSILALSKVSSLPLYFLSLILFYHLFLDIQLHLTTDSLQTVDSPPGPDALVRVCAEKDLPSNEQYINLTTNKDLPTVEEWLSIYAGVIDISLEDEVSFVLHCSFAHLYFV